MSKMIEVSLDMNLVNLPPAASPEADIACTPCDVFLSAESSPASGELSSAPQPAEAGQEIRGVRPRILSPPSVEPPPSPPRSAAEADIAGSGHSRIVLDTPSRVGHDARAAELTRRTTLEALWAAVQWADTLRTQATHMRDDTHDTSGAREQRAGRAGRPKKRRSPKRPGTRSARSGPGTGPPGHSPVLEPDTGGAQ